MTNEFDFDLEQFENDYKAGKFDINFPSYDRIAKALLCLIHFKGNELNSSDAYEPLADHFNLSEYAKSISRGDHFRNGPHPQSAWHCLVQWGIRSLRKDGFVELTAPRGVWRLTENGIRQAVILSKVWPTSGSQTTEAD
jgi:hypothetical protein